MSIYDKNGNAIDGGNITDEQVKKAFVTAIADGTINAGATVGATLSVRTYNANWETYCRTAYASLLEAYKTNPNNCIPFFICTDQHGFGLQPHKFINNIDTDGMNIININLGDTVQDEYGESTIQGFWNDVKQVKNYIGVVGNHECKHGTDRMYELTLNKVFSTTNLQRRNPPSKCDCYAVNDTLHNVKWMVLEDYYINADGTGYTHGFDSATIDWVIEELSANDGLDIIIVMHWPCWRTAMKRSDSSESANTDSWNASAYLLWDFFCARKNKTSGTYADITGTSHSYDFTNSKTDLLCTLHGHTHAEWFSTAYGLTAYAANRYYPSSTNQGKCVFGLVDRTNECLKIWEFNADGVSELLTLDV